MSDSREDSGFSTGKPRRIHWTCRYVDCGRSFTTWTRRGLRVTCPSCHRVQEGPEGVRRLVESKRQPRKAATVVTVVSATNTTNGAAHKPPARLKPTPPAAKPPEQRARKPATPPPVAQSSGKDILSRVLGF